jgi:APA family basic amino acid/polyamine antiporter
MVLGNMDIGLNTANLAAIVVITLLTLLNTFGVKMGARCRTSLPRRRCWRCWRWWLVGLLAKNALRLRRTLGRGGITSGHNGVAYAACGAGGRGRADGYVGMLTMVAVVQVGSLFSAPMRGTT